MLLTGAPKSLELTRRSPAVAGGQLRLGHGAAQYGIGEHAGAVVAEVGAQEGAFILPAGPEPGLTG